MRGAVGWGWIRFTKYGVGVSWCLPGVMGSLGRDGKAFIKGDGYRLCRYESQPAIPLYPNTQVDITGLASYDDIQEW
jgi:hypothetical protein